jgi:hypothetical protein
VSCPVAARRGLVGKLTGCRVLPSWAVQELKDLRSQLHEAADCCGEGVPQHRQQEAVSSATAAPSLLHSHKVSGSQSFWVEVRVVLRGTLLARDFYTSGRK